MLSLHDPLPEFDRLAIWEQSAFANGIASNPTRNWRKHLGINHIDARQFCLGLGLLPCRHGVVVLLLTDRTGLLQALITLGQALCRNKIGLGVVVLEIGRAHV